MAADGSVVIDTSIDDDRVVRGLRNIDNAMQRTEGEGRTLTTGFDIMDVALGSLVSGGIEAAISGFIAFSQEIVNSYAEIGKVSDIVGMSTTAYQEWDGILKQTGYSMEAASGDFAMLAEKALDASNGVGEGAELFSRLGVEVEGVGGKLKTQEQLFEEVVASLQSMEDGTEKAALATALLGTTGEELMPVLNGTNEELERMKSSVNVVSPETIQTMEEFKQTWSVISNNLMAIAATVLTPFLQLLNGILEFFFVWEDTAVESTEKVADKMSSTNSDIESGQQQHYDKMLSMGKEYNADLEKLTEAEKSFRQANLSEFESELKEKYDLTNLNQARRYQEELDEYKQKLDRQLGLDEEYLKDKSDMYKRWLDNNQITIDKYNQLMGALGGNNYNNSISTSTTYSTSTFNVYGAEGARAIREEINMQRRV